MSKAFTKEDSGSELEPDQELARALEEAREKARGGLGDNQDDKDPEEGGGPADGKTPQQSGFKNYMTPAGAEKLRGELKKLLYEDRPQVVQTVSWAASNGDRSENGDYIYGKRRLREIDRRIRFLTKRLESAAIVDPAGQAGISPNKVLFGAKVTLAGEDGRKRTYRIVGIDEANPSAGDISWISPLAKAILNASLGEVVNFRSPKGEEEIEIIAVEYV